MDEAESDAEQASAPRFVDGVPANLEAAALDALTWLEWWQGYLSLNHRELKWDENRRRLTLCIQTLKQFIPDVEPAFEVLQQEVEEPTPMWKGEWQKGGDAID
jgi:hypothetical protein